MDTEPIQQRRAGRGSTRRRRAIYLAGAGVLALSIGWGLVVFTADPPPTPAFEDARRALSEARAGDAERYAPRALRAAENQWNHAYAAWQRESARWFPLRDYDAARRAAEDAGRLGRHAAARAGAVRDSLLGLATAGLPLVSDQLDALKARTRRVPYDPSWHATLTRAERALSEGESALARQDLWTAARKAKEAGAALGRVGQDVTHLIEDYLAGLPAWQQQHADLVDWSTRRRAPAIVVDKLAHRLYLYDAGRLKQTVPVELGPSWLGPKRHEGDLSTPEGRYRVTRKRGPGETTYHRALDLDYPNEADRQRFQEEKRRGTLPPEARIGGHIEIHGEGGRGANWTEGCVALHNADMDALFQAVPVGTPVLIVGALERPAFADEKTLAPAAEEPAEEPAGPAIRYSP